MPTTTYTPIASVTLSASASEVVFSGLPQTYRDLILVSNTLATVVTYSKLRLNGDSGSNYSSVVARGASIGANSYSGTNPEYYPEFYANISATNRNLTTTQFMDYSATDKQKTILGRYTGADDSGNIDRVGMIAGRWANTAAITSISITTNSGSFASGSTFNLFGVIA